MILRGQPGATYNVGSGDERSIEEIADAVLDALDKPQTLKTYVDDRPGHDRRYLLDHSKITQELGWRPAVPFEQGIRETVGWYADNRPWWEPKKRAMRRVGVPPLSVDPHHEQAPIAGLQPAHGLLPDPTPRRM